MINNQARNICSVSDIGAGISVAFGVGVRVLDYFKAWLLSSRGLQSNCKEKTDIFLELVTNLNYGALTCYHVSGINSKCL